MDKINEDVNPEIGTLNSDSCTWTKKFAFCTDPYNGYVEDTTQFDKLMEAFETETGSRFVKCRGPKSLKNNFGKDYDSKLLQCNRLRWEDNNKDNRPYLKFDGIPFIIVGSLQLECQHGPLRFKKKIPAEDGVRTNYGVVNGETGCPTKKQRKLPPSKKADCKAVVRIRHIFRFPEFSVKKNTEHHKKSTVKRLKEAAKAGELKFDQRYVVELPRTHNGHAMGWKPKNRLKQRMNSIETIRTGSKLLSTLTYHIKKTENAPLTKRIAHRIIEAVRELVAVTPADKIEQIEASTKLSLTTGRFGPLPKRKHKPKVKQVTVVSKKEEVVCPPPPPTITYVPAPPPPSVTIPQQHHTLQHLPHHHTGPTIMTHWVDHSDAPQYYFNYREVP